MEAPFSMHSTGESMGQTRVVGSEARTTGSSTGKATDPTVASPFKETRIATSDDIEAGRYEMPAGADQAEAGGRTAPPRKFGWPLYAAALAAVLLVVVGIAIVLIKTRSANAPTPTDGTDQTPPVAGEQLPPANDSGQPAASPADQNAGADSASDKTAIDLSNADANRETKSKNVKTNKADAANGEESNSNSRPSASPITENSATMRDGSSPNANANAGAVAGGKAAAENANANKNAKKKGGGIGGFFKRVFGGGDDNKKSENKPKPDKKP
jgi:hypothetical protein